MRRIAGVTLPEVLIVMVMLGAVTAAVFTVLMQASYVYQRDIGHLTAQSDEMVAMRRMERDLRESMTITRADNPRWITLIPPKKGGEEILNQLSDNIEAQRIILDADTEHPVHYFLGQPNTPVPDANGTVLYRAIGPQNGTALTQTEVILDHVTTADLFDCHDQHFVRVTLRIPVIETTRAGRKLVDQTISTDYFVRNIIGDTP